MILIPFIYIYILIVLLMIYIPFIVIILSIVLGLPDYSCPLVVRVDINYNIYIIYPSFLYPIISPLYPYFIFHIPSQITTNIFNIYIYIYKYIICVYIYIHTYKNIYIYIMYIYIQMISPVVLLALPHGIFPVPFRATAERTGDFAVALVMGI